MHPMDMNSRPREQTVDFILHTADWRCHLQSKALHMSLVILPDRDNMLSGKQISVCGFDGKAKCPLIWSHTSERHCSNLFEKDVEILVRRKHQVNLVCHALELSIASQALQAPACTACTSNFVISHHFSPVSHFRSCAVAMLVLGGTEGEIICADAEAWDGLQRALTKNQKNILRFLRSKPLSAASGVTSFKRAGDVLVGHSGVLTSWIDKCRKRRTRWRFKMFQEICKDESSTDWHQRQAVLRTVRGTVVSLGWVIGLIGYIGSYNGL